MSSHSDDGNAEGPLTSQSVTRRIRWPEPGQARGSEPPSPKNEKKFRGRIFWIAGVGAVAATVVIIAVLARRPSTVATAAASAPRVMTPLAPPVPTTEPLPQPSPSPPPPPPTPAPVAPVAAPAPTPPAPVTRVAPPGSYEALLSEGEHALSKRQLERACDAFERAVRARPRAAAAHHGLGRCLVQEGDPAAAADHFKHAARAGLVEAWFDLGEAQRVLAANDEALESYRKYLAAGGGSRAGRARKLIDQLASR